MLFLSRDPHKAQLAQQIVNQELAKETLSVAGWRKVPTNPKVLGPIALDSLPDIQQVFISAPASIGVSAMLSAVCILRVVALKTDYG